ncbi:MAG TPA: hypothetical protein VLL76_05080, partial [Candidatus Omnitrophota bacterium]|nr:hypothetical protein [Candidatus Omnitrophota bacterium]
ALGDLAEGLAPPSDADSLAYHFAIPRQILAEGCAVFVERAADGAAPLLQQMTYLAALALGGETALTLWCMLSGWAAILVTYALARRWLSRAWALTVAAVFMTLPAFLYGAGTGQVEARLAGFTVVAVAAAVAAGRGGGPGAAVVAGLAGGFAMASKYPGLLLVALCGLVILGRRGGLGRAVAYSAAALAVGSQWYVWNWLHTGDPVFPMLFGVLPYHPSVAWNPDQHAAFGQWVRTLEAPSPRGVVDMLLYPLRAILDAPEAWEAGRTGLGPAALLLAPFAAVGAWRRRHGLATHDLTVMAAVCVGFYLLWFFFGASQRVRHYLPFMPLILVGLAVAAHRAVRGAPTRHAVAAALAATIMVQSAAQAIMVRPFVQRMTQGQTREEYLIRTVPFAFAPFWINATLDPASHKVLTTARQWLYLLDVPYHLVHPYQQAVVEARPGMSDVGRFWAQMRAAGITHVALFLPTTNRLVHTGEGGMVDLIVLAQQAGCLGEVKRLEGPVHGGSRTLSGFGGATLGSVSILALTPAGCPFARAVSIQMEPAPVFAFGGRPSGASQDQTPLGLIGSPARPPSTP